MVGARVAEPEAEIDRQEARLARATEANVVTLHPATIAVYLDAVEQLAKALSAADAKAPCLGGGRLYRVLSRQSDLLDLSFLRHQSDRSQAAGP